MSLRGERYKIDVSGTVITGQEVFIISAGGLHSTYGMTEGSFPNHLFGKDPSALFVMIRSESGKCRAYDSAKTGILRDCKTHIEHPIERTEYFLCLRYTGQITGQNDVPDSVIARGKDADHTDGFKNHVA